MMDKAIYRRDCNSTALLKGIHKKVEDLQDELKQTRRYGGTFQERQNAEDPNLNEQQKNLCGEQNAAKSCLQLPLCRVNVHIVGRILQKYFQHERETMKKSNRKSLQRRTRSNAAKTSHRVHDSAVTTPTCGALVKRWPDD